MLNHPARLNKVVAKVLAICFFIFAGQFLLLNNSFAGFDSCVESQTRALPEITATWEEPAVENWFVSRGGSGGFKNYFGEYVHTYPKYATLNESCASGCCFHLSELEREFRGR